MDVSPPVTKLVNESLLLPALGAAGGVCGDDGAPKSFVGDGGVETFPLFAKLENESLFPVGVESVDGDAPKLLLVSALALTVDGAPKFEFGADCCLAKYSSEGEDELLGGNPLLFRPCM